VQYLLMRSLALLGEVECRNAVILDSSGTVGADPIFAMCGRRQWRRCKKSESGLSSIVKRERRLGWM